jgi:flagellin-like hook-associated protein FlgL
MWRRRLIVLVGLGVLLAGAVPAQAGELLEGTNVVATATSAVDDPVGTVTSTATDAVGTANDAVGTVTTNAGDAVGTGTSTASGTAGSIVGGVNAGSQTPTASSSAGSSSDGSGGTSSSDRRRTVRSPGDRKAPGRSYHTRFDRLPRRAEVLLERIELGRNMRANLRRLEGLLRRSPPLRAEIARALRSELARLRKGGLTHAERRQVRRLVRVQRGLAPSASGPSSTLDSASALDSSGSLSPISGVESAATSPQNATSQGDVAGAHAPREANGSGNGIFGALPLPDVDRWPAWLMTLLDVVLWFCILALVAIFLSPFRRAFR